MKIKLLTRMAGPQVNAGPGEELDLPREQAQHLIAGGYAIPLEKPARLEKPVEVPAPAPVEQAVKPPAPERAVSARGRTGKK